MADVIDLAVE
jgi:hypothetical protein